MDSPHVAIVILNWNGKSFLEKFLPSVVATQYEHKQIIIADNASTDDSITFLQQHYPQLKIIQNPTNEGFAKGYNTALKQVCADYYVLLNSDVEVTPHWLQPMLDLMESDSSIAACQPKLLSFEHRDQFEYAGASGGWLDNLGYPFTRGRVFDTFEQDHGQYDSVEPCFWASGAALFVRANVYHALKGFDDYFFAHQEEIDLCWRMQLHGYKIYVHPSSVVYHVGGGTLPKGNSRKVYLNFRNNLIMLAKNLPLSKACMVLPMRFCLDALVAYKELGTGDVGYFAAVWKAHMGFFHWLFFIKKNTSRPKQPSRNIVGRYRGSVIFQYFIRKRKHFSEIIGIK